MAAWQTFSCIPAIEFWQGKQRWIDARAAALVRVRGMSQAEALAKAKEEFAYFTALDRRRSKQTDH
jgi:hypothetical protein